MSYRSKGKVKSRPKGKQQLLPHAQMRLRQRYGIQASFDDIEAMNRQIRCNRSVAIGRQSASRSWHIVTHEGQELLAAYNRRAGCIATFLEMDWLASGAEHLQTLTEEGEARIEAALPEGAEPVSAGQ